MPTVFEKDGYRFFFYSNDHRPIHVRFGHGEAVFNLEGETALRESQGMKINPQLATLSSQAAVRRQICRRRSNVLE